MTVLLNGQEMKVRFGSTSVTARRGSIRLMKRAQVAPPKPPPTTTTRPAAPCAKLGRATGRSIAAPAAAVLRNSRRFLVMAEPPCSFLRAVPRGDRLDFVIGEA